MLHFNREPLDGIDPHFLFNLDIPIGFSHTPVRMGMIMPDAIAPAFEFS
jgi:hypothetical protein